MFTLLFSGRDHEKLVSLPSNSPVNPSGPGAFRLSIIDSSSLVIDMGLLPLSVSPSGFWQTVFQGIGPSRLGYPYVGVVVCDIP